jgi:hypothetical protein
MTTSTAPVGSPAFAKQQEDVILKMLLKGPRTRAQLGGNPYRLRLMLDAKLVKRAGEVKQGSARKAVTYELTARGRKRAEKLG